jgi:hypothetical protein
MGCAAGPVPEGAGLFLRGGPGRQEARALADDHAHAGDPEGLSPPFVRHSQDEGGLAAIW